ncbi:MAG: hypothetical protein WC700_04055 [Gemmatimonadaceae bacterium]|jgi:hypothetical protein
MDAIGAIFVWAQSWWGPTTAAAAQQPKATVKVSMCSDDGAITDWEFVFKLATHELAFSFTARAPYLHPFEDWEAIAAGAPGATLCAHQGNGDGRISIEGDQICFETFPAGDAKGSRLVCPKALFAEPLSKAIAYAAGIPFDPQKPEKSVHEV